MAKSKSRHGRGTGIPSAKKPPSYEPDPMATRETLQLVRAYYKIKDAEIRKRLYELAKAIGAGASRSD